MPHLKSCVLLMQELSMVKRDFYIPDFICYVLHMFRMPNYHIHMYDIEKDY